MWIGLWNARALVITAYGDADMIGAPGLQVSLAIRSYLPLASKGGTPTTGALQTNANAGSVQ
jgi:hypothetical protein